MAILDDVPGVEVTVRVAGNETVEYDPCEEERHSLAESATCPTVTKYIECIDEADFSIKIAASRRYAWGYRSHCLRFVVYIDGNQTTSRLISSPGDMTIHNKNAFCQQSRQWKSYKLRFSAVSTTDDGRKERVAQDREIAQHLGRISVVVGRSIKLGHKPRGTKRKRLANHSQKFELAEKSTKGRAISHGTAFSYMGKTPVSEYTYSSINLPDDHGPIAVFNFLYRSRDALQKMLIMPRKASFTPSFAELSPAEIERLAKERFEQIQRGRRLKKEAKPTLGRRVVKTEDLTKANENRTSAKRPAEFIDLTID
ncbi:hypothetical protein F4782DRAFT_478412 [Xylaria castorea]|nr:hypothetical protein F4782DRAFT_478412 [Xylaria castorea]